MASITGQLAAGIVGRVADADGWAGPVALAAVPLVPAVALAEAGAAGVRAVGRLWRLARQTAAALLREAAEALDPLPVAAEAEEWPEGRWTLAPAAEEAPAPIILPMPSAAQVTAEEAPAVLPLRPAGDDLAALLAEHGSVRAAARALGVAESTLRGRCRKAGVRLPGRKAKG